MKKKRKALDPRVVDLYDRIYRRFGGCVSDTPCWESCPQTCCPPANVLVTFRGELKYRKLRGLNNAPYFQVRKKDKTILCKAEGRCEAEKKPLFCRLFPFFLERKRGSKAFRLTSATFCQTETFSRQFMEQVLALIAALQGELVNGVNICRPPAKFTSKEAWRELRL